MWIKWVFHIQIISLHLPVKRITLLVCKTQMSLNLLGIADLLCFIHPDKSALVSLAPLKRIEEKLRATHSLSAMSRLPRSQRSANRKRWPAHMMCDCLSLQSVRSLSHSACSKAPSSTQKPLWPEDYSEWGQRVYFMPASPWELTPDSLMCP